MTGLPLHIGQFIHFRCTTRCFDKCFTVPSPLSQSWYEYCPHSRKVHSALHGPSAPPCTSTRDNSPVFCPCSLPLLQCHVNGTTNVWFSVSYFVSMPSRSTHINHIYQQLVSFYCWAVFHYTDIPTLFRWAFRSFPVRWTLTLWP